MSLLPIHKLPGSNRLRGFVVMSGDPQVPADSVRVGVSINDPTPNDDEGEGFGVLSPWLNTGSGDYFVCLDATEGEAVWVRMAKAEVDGGYRIKGSGEVQLYNPDMDRYHTISVRGIDNQQLGLQIEDGEE